jgi:hypothetical protein
MMKRIISTVLVFASVVVCQTTSATVINYNAIALGGNSFEYVYTVQNDTLQVPIKEFTIWFDEQLCGNLQIMTQAPLSNNWGELLLSSAGFGVPLGYDALKVSGGISQGESISGFVVRFDWLSVGRPGSQLFEVIDPSDSQTIESGHTVPEPLTISLLCLGWLMLKWSRSAGLPKLDQKPSGW